MRGGETNTVTLKWVKDAVSEKFRYADVVNGSGAFKDVESVDFYDDDSYPLFKSEMKDEDAKYGVTLNKKQDEDDEDDEGFGDFGDSFGSIITLKLPASEFNAKIPLPDDGKAEQQLTFEYEEPEEDEDEDDEDEDDEFGPPPAYDENSALMMLQPDGEDGLPPTDGGRKGKKRSSKKRSSKKRSSKKSVSKKRTG